jgi:succinate dehydrogenase/fumarate reductase flavoprotein subunit
MWQHATLPYLRSRGPFASPGGMVTDWNLQSNLPGLFAAGNAIYAGNYYHHASATGRYAGRKAAAFAKTAEAPVLSEDQVNDEKRRIFAPIHRTKGMDWKELRSGLCRIMQHYCGDIKNEKLLNIGLIWLKDIRDTVVPEMSADNPHMLMRVLETLHMIDCDELILKASLARKASSRHLGFTRQDYPELDPPEWHKLITIKQVEGGIEVGERPLDFAGSLPEHYVRYNPDYRGFLKDS